MGEPILFDDTVALPFRVSERGYEAIAALLSERLGVQASQAGSALKGGAFFLTCDGDTTHITLRSDLKQLRNSVFAGSWLAVVFGGLPLLGILMDTTQSGIALGLHAVWAVPTLALAGGFGMRRLAARRAREGKQKHQGTLAAVLDLAQQHRVEVAAPVAARVRVSAGEAASAAAELADELAAPEREALTTRDARVAGELEG